MGNVVIIQPVSSGLLMANSAVNLGHRVTVLSANTGDRILAGNVDSRIEVREVDTNNFDQLLHAVQDINQQQKIEAILPGFEFYVPAQSVRPVMKWPLYQAKRQRLVYRIRLSVN